MCEFIDNPDEFTYCKCLYQRIGNIYNLYDKLKKKIHICLFNLLHIFLCKRSHTNIYSNYSHRFYIYFYVEKQFTVPPSSLSCLSSCQQIILEISICNTNI